MNGELIPLSFDKVLQTRTYTVVIMGNEKKRFAIYTDAQIGKTLQMQLTDTPRARPSTHDLVEMILKGLDVKIIRVVISDIQETVYFAKLFLEQEIGSLRHIVEVDSRPSDCITLALMHNVPVYCTQEVFEKAVAMEE